jgi:hypothetical protein
MLGHECQGIHRWRGGIGVGFQGTELSGDMQVSWMGGWWMSWAVVFTGKQLKIMAVLNTTA